MHRHRPTQHGTQPKASLMTRLDKSGFTGIVVSILVLSLHRLGRRGVRTAVLSWVLGIMAGIVTGGNSVNELCICACAAGEFLVIYDSVLSGW